ncbi:GGDEF domain-containing protein [Anaerosolibacter carboniphilus]|nr:GGDEF domain-containing protein [Anaerosolibacter carboniphilus]
MDFRGLQSIFVMLNEQCKMIYCSIEDRKMAEEIIRDIDIEASMNGENIIVKEKEDFNLKIEKIDLENTVLFAVTMEKQFHLELIYQDYFTGLYNRNYWEHIQSGTIKFPRVSNYTVVMIDIDNLKELNDTCGHGEGDRAIKTVGMSIKQCIREGDIGIHYGGDEFLLLLFDSDIKGAEKVIYRIRQEVASKNENSGIIVEISTGIAYSNCLKSLQNTVQIADMNMYMEKKTKYKNKRKGQKSYRRSAEKGK